MELKLIKFKADDAQGELCLKSFTRNKNSMVFLDHAGIPIRPIGEFEMGMKIVPVKDLAYAITSINGLITAYSVKDKGPTSVSFEYVAEYLSKEFPDPTKLGLMYEAFLMIM